MDQKNPARQVKPFPCIKSGTTRDGMKQANRAVYGLWKPGQKRALSVVCLNGIVSCTEEFEQTQHITGLFTFSQHDTHNTAIQEAHTNLPNNTHSNNTHLRKQNFSSGTWCDLSHTVTPNNSSRALRLRLSTWVWCSGTVTQVLKPECLARIVWSHSVR